MRPLLIGLAWAVLAGCNPPTMPTVPLDQNFTLAPGEAVYVAHVPTRIRFVDVQNDSRCPADVFCILGGDAIVRIEVSRAGRSEMRQLHTGNPQPVGFADLVIVLVDLTPYPFSSGPIRPGDYRLTLRVSS